MWGWSDLRRAGAISAVLAAAAATAGCGANIPTELAKAPAAGAAGQIAHIEIRNLFVLGAEPGKTLPAGGAAPVYFSMVSRPLTAETENASGGMERPPGIDTLESVTSPAARSSRMIGAAPQAPAGQYVQVGPAAKVVLEGLAGPLMSGGHVRVTLRFRVAGSGTFDVPVLPKDTYWKTYAPAPPGG